jgi:hypothetical protein
MKKYYKVNYSLLALLLTPIVLRMKIFMGLLSSMMRPLELLHTKFITYAESLITKANAQICYMQSIINDEFDYYQRRIIVRNITPDTDALLLWKENQNKPMMLQRDGAENPLLLNRDGQIGANNIDFEAVLPFFFILSTDEERRIKTIINKNKLASKKYRIINE